MEERKEEMEQQRIAFIATALKLDTEQAQDFWPLYNENREAQESIRKEGRKLWKDLEGLKSSASESEMDQYMQAKSTHMKQRMDLDESYYAQLKKVLKPEQIAALYASERDFRRHMMRKMGRGDKRGGDMERGDGRGTGPGQRRGK